MFLSFPSLKKSVSVVVTLTLLATFFLPIASHAESVEVQQEIIYPEGYNEKVAEWKGSTPIIKEGDTNGITPHGKIGVTLKALKAALEKIWDKVPNWVKGYISLEGLFEGLDLFIGISDTVEELIRYAVDYAAPDWVPDSVISSIAKIIVWLLPIV